MWKNIDEKIISVKGFCLSSKFSEGKIYGQHLGVKTFGFIEIITESGKKGFGENYASVYAPEILPKIVEFLEIFLKGKKIGDQNLLDKFNKVPIISRNGILRSICGSVEVAIWDLRGKLLNKPTYKLLGKKRDKVPCYASGGSISMTKNEISKEVEKSLEEGFTAYKMRVGLQTWSKDLQRVKCAREELGKKDLMIDAIMGTIDPHWELKDASKKIDNLKKFNPRWIEEPLHPNNIEGFLKLRSKCKVPIAAGEAYSGILEFETIIRNKLVDVLQFDCTHSGGIEFCQYLSKISKKKKIECAIHVWGSPVALAANTHLAHSLENIVYLEIPRVKFEISKHLFFDHPKILNGHIKISDAPGIGVNITNKTKENFPFVKGSAFSLKK